MNLTERNTFVIFHRNMPILQRNRLANSHWQGHNVVKSRTCEKSEVARLLVEQNTQVHTSIQVHQDTCEKSEVARLLAFHKYSVRVPRM